MVVDSQRVVKEGAMARNPASLFKWVLWCLLPVWILTYSTGLAQPIKIPKTGQTHCYNNDGEEVNCIVLGLGQDGLLQKGATWPDPRFVSTSVDCIVDQLTGLMWSRNGNLNNGIGTTWQESLTAIATINSNTSLCDYQDWRMPNIRELATLINSEVGQGQVWLNGQGFVNVRGVGYWSSTTDVRTDFRRYAYFLLFHSIGEGKSIEVRNKGEYASYLTVRTHQQPLPATTPGRTGQTLCYNASPGTQILCLNTGQDGDTLAGTSYPVPRFRPIEQNGSIDCYWDTATNLIWPKNMNPYVSGSTWQQGLDYIAALNAGSGLCGYKDWRMPNRHEMFSLLDYSRYNPVLPLGHPFSPIYLGPYWTSTSAPYQNNIADAVWAISLSIGLVTPLTKIVPNANFTMVRSILLDQFLFLPLVLK